MPNQTSVIQIKSDTVASACSESVSNLQELAHYFSNYMVFYWARHNIDFNCNLTEFPARIILEYKQLPDSKLLTSVQQAYFLKSHARFKSFSSEPSFYVSRTSADKDNRMKETNRFFELLANLDLTKADDKKLLLQQFIDQVSLSKTKVELFSSTSIASSASYYESLKNSAAKLASSAGWSYLSTLEKIFNIFKFESVLPATDRSYFENIILPINNNKFSIKEFKTMNEQPIKAESPEHPESTSTSPVAAAQSIARSNTPESPSSTSSESKVSEVKSDESAHESTEAKSLLARTKDRLSGLLSLPSLRLPGMPACAAITAVTALSVASLCAYRSGYRPSAPSSLLNLFKSDSNSDSQSATAGVVKKTAKAAVKPVVRVVTQRTCR